MLRKMLVFSLENIQGTEEKSVSRSSGYLVGGGHLLAIDGEHHQAGGQIDQAADLQVHVAAARGVGSAGGVAAPDHVAVTPLHTVTAQSASQSLSYKAEGVLVDLHGFG